MIHKDHSRCRYNQILMSAASALAISLAGATSLAQAQQPVQVEVPAKPLNEALGEIGNVYGVTVIAPDALVRGKTAPAVSDTLTAEQAIKRLLRGSDLTFRMSRDSGFIIEQSTAEVAPPSPRQAATDPVPVEPEEPRMEDEVVVTGRFQQSVIDRIPISPEELPFSLSVLSRDLIDQRNFIQPSDILLTLPNTGGFFNDGYGAQEVLTRGFQTRVLVNNRVQAGRGLRDDSFVESYESLRGPASIALGPAQGGGVINTITKSPKAENFYDFKFATDQFGTFIAETDINVGSLFDNDKVRFRLNSAYRDFQFDADETKLEQIAVRPVFEFDSSDQTSAQFSVAYFKTNTRPNLGFALFSDGSIPDQITTDTFTGLQNGSGELEDIYVEGEFVHQFLDNLKLTLRGSYQESSQYEQDVLGLYNYLYDDGSPGIGLDNPVVFTYDYLGKIDEDLLFLDAQLAYDFDIGGNKQDFVFAVAYNEGTRKGDFALGVPFVPISLDDLDQPRFGNSADLTLEPFADDDTELFSVLFETALRPTDWLTFVGGIRYDGLKQNSLFGNSITDVEDFTFRFGISSEVSNGINIYASYAEAFFPNDGLTTDLEIADPETTDSFEVGAKFDLFDEKLSVTTALFRTFRRNIETSGPFSEEGGVFTVLLVGEQRNQGAEVTVNWRPINGLNFNLNYGYTDQKILEASDDVTPFSFPDHTLSAFLTYQFQSGPLSGLQLGGGPRYNSSKPSNGTLNGEVVNFPDFTVVDLFASYPINEYFNVSVNIINATDEKYLEGAGFFRNTLTGAAQLGAPLTARLSLKATF